MSDLVRGMQDNQSEGLTNNGCKTYTTSLCKLVDLFGMGASMRKRSRGSKIKLFSDAFTEDKLIALKILFYLRDCRGGQGERDFFRVCIHWLGNNYPDVVIKNLENIVEFGRYDDLFILRKTKSQDAMFDYVKSVWIQDLANYKSEKPLSLLSKWMPSENASSKSTVANARWFIRKLKITKKSYRETLSKLRKSINVVETKMSNNEWSEIDYSAVPSNAARIYRHAFVKHDRNRYAKFLINVEKGTSKIHATTLYPYELLKEYLEGGWGMIFKKQIDPTIESQWKALPDYFGDRSENSLCVVDTSSSMHGIPICVAISLGIYAAERNKSIFKDCFITFSEKPTLQEIKGDTLLEKARFIASSDWDMNTNLYSVFKLILDTAIKNNLPSEKMVQRLYIISDMEFDESIIGMSMFDVIKKLYDNAGYFIPEIIFWNVDSKQNNVPVRFNSLGVALVSGYSPSIFETVVGGSISTPVDVMFNIINKQRYNRIGI